MSPTPRKLTEWSCRNGSRRWLSPGYYAARIDPERRKRSHIRQLEALGYTGTLEPAA
jgi:hypothetical protein